MGRLEHSISAALLGHGEWQAAREILAHALGDLEQYLLQNPDDRDAGLDYADCLFNAARSAELDNRCEEALELYEHATAQHARWKDGYRSLRYLALIYCYISRISARIPRPAGPGRVLRVRRRACEELAKLCAPRSRSVSAQGSDPEGWDRLATILQAHQAIWPRYEEGSQVAQAESGQFFVAWMIDHGALSRRLTATPGAEEAPEVWAASVLSTIRERCATLGVNHLPLAVICRWLSDRLQHEASLWRRLGKLERAQRTAAELLALARVLVREFPQRVESQIVLCQAYTQIANNARKGQDLRETVGSLELAWDAAGDALKLDPLSEDARLHAARVAKKLDDIKAEMP
jgi:hypothetical protein